METQIQAVSGEQLAIVMHEDGPKVVVVSRVGWRRLEDASKQKQVELMQKQVGLLAVVQSMGGMTFVHQLMSARDSFKHSPKQLGGDAIDVGEQPEPDAPEPKPDPADQYDTGILLSGGVRKIDKLAPKASQIDDWTPELATEAARCILKLSRPMLFETEADRKNA